MSSKIQDKQQTQDKSHHLDADSLLNKHIFNTLAYTFTGYAAGMTVSLLFKRKAGIPMLMAGAGAGYGLTNLYSDMNRMKQFQGHDSSSNTLKRDESLGTKDWDKFQQKEESLQTNKPRFGGSDSDDDNKSSGSMTEYSGSKKTSSKPGNETKSQTQSKETDKKPSDKGGKSNEGVGAGKDQNQLFNLEGGAYNNRGDSSSKASGKTDTKDTHKGHDLKTDKSTGLKGVDAHTGTKGGSSHSQQSDSSKRDINNTHKGHDLKTEKSTGFKGVDTQSGSKSGSTSETETKKTHGSAPSSSNRQADVNGSKLGGEDPKYDDPHGKHLSLNDSKEPGKLQQGTSLMNQRGGEQTKRVNEQMKNSSNSNLPLQDRWGSTNKSGFKNNTESSSEGKAGGQFRGSTTAGSQVNAVIE